MPDPTTDPEVAAAVAEAQLTVIGPAIGSVGHDGGLIVEAPLHSSKVRALAQRPGFSVTPSGPKHSIIWRYGWRRPDVERLSISPTRTQHMAELAAATSGIGDPEVFGSTEIGAQVADLTKVTTHTTFAVLRDIADAEPIEELAYSSEVRCVMCGASATPVAGGRHPHLISCPWARAVQIVGVKTDG